MSGWTDGWICGVMFMIAMRALFGMLAEEEPDYKAQAVEYGYAQHVMVGTEGEAEFKWNCELEEGE